VFATAGSEEKCQFLETLGAISHPYPLEDFSQWLKPEAEDPGVDVILDIVGGRYLSRHIDLLNPGGRLLLIGLLGGGEAALNLTAVLKKHLTLKGSTLRNRSLSQKTAIRDALLERIWPEIEAGRIKTFVDSVFPLEAATEAHQRMKSSLHIGKMVLEVRP
jgi:NADPH2:quinone reductase